MVYLKDRKLNLTLPLWKNFRHIIIQLLKKKKNIINASKDSIFCGGATGKLVEGTVYQHPSQEM